MILNRSISQNDQIEVYYDCTDQLYRILVNFQNLNKKLKNIFKIKQNEVNEMELNAKKKIIKQKYMNLKQTAHKLIQLIKQIEENNGDSRISQVPQPDQKMLIFQPFQPNKLIKIDYPPSKQQKQKQQGNKNNIYLQQQSQQINSIEPCDSTNNYKQNQNLKNLQEILFNNDDVILQQSSNSITDSNMLKMKSPKFPSEGILNYDSWQQTPERNKDKYLQERNVFKTTHSVYIRTNTGESDKMNPHLHELRQNQNKISQSKKSINMKVIDKKQIMHPTNIIKKSRKIFNSQIYQPNDNFINKRYFDSEISNKGKNLQQTTKIDPSFSDQKIISLYQEAQLIQSPTKKVQLSKFLTSPQLFNDTILKIENSLHLRDFLKVIERKTQLSQIKEILMSYLAQIKEMDFLSQLKAINLQKLEINHSRISEIKSLIECDFPKLQYLCMTYTKRIQDISLLKSVRFPELLNLNLAGNIIKNIDCLTQCNFPKLQLLYLNDNRIQSIESLGRTNFPNLKELNLGYNLIKETKVFIQVEFPKLQLLQLTQNKINNTQFILKSKSKKLKKIEITRNPIAKQSLVYAKNFIINNHFDIVLITE